jgi:hypothetical protein
MNSNPHNAMNSDSGPHSGPSSGSGSGEETLRLIAGLPAPAGLEERVRRALRAAPRSGRVLEWPPKFHAKAALESNWMRAAAAAAIVFVVVGGGWGVYSRVQPGPGGKVIVMQQRMPSSGGMPGAGAIRTPVTIPGPRVKEQETKGSSDQETQTAKKSATPKKTATGQRPASKPAQQPAVSQ